MRKRQRVEMGALPDQGECWRETGNPGKSFRDEIADLWFCRSLESLRHGLFGILTSEGWRMSRREFWKESAR